MRMCKFVFSVLLLIGSIGSASAQTNEGDYSITYGVNYSAADRKDTAFPGFVGPASLAYRPKCFLMLGADDDTFVSNKTATGRATGIGDLAFEAHLRFWNFHGDNQGSCEAGTKLSWNLDYVVTVPVGTTLESKELVHQTKLTFNRPLDGKRGNFFANAGVNSAGLSGGGTTQNALASANYLRYFQPGGAWGGEAELDLQSKSKIAPSSAVVLLAIDGALDKAQKWSIRFGSSFGVTPYSPKVSPFIQISFNGNLKGSNNAPASVFTK
jgi:hypothetical protein